MKKNNIFIILLIFINLFLVAYIVFDKNIIDFSNNEETKNEEENKLIDEIKLDYVSIALYEENGEKIAYIVPITNEEIEKINGGNNLKERLIMLYNRSFYYDVYLVNNKKLRGYRINLDNNVSKLIKIEKNDSLCIVLLKENNTIAIFDYEKYFNELNTMPIDNYKNYKNVLDIVDNKVIYLDGSSELIK